MNLVNLQACTFLYTSLHKDYRYFILDAYVHKYSNLLLTVGHSQKNHKLHKDADLKRIVQ